MKLSTENFEKAIHFIKTKARPIDRLVFEHHFEDASAEAVLTELSRYQNEDGGFGRSLEPDFRLEASSPLATTVGLQIVRALGRLVSQPIVVKAMHYLLNAFDEDTGYWSTVPPAVNDVPHAPWWTYDPAANKSGPGTPANPSAEIAGYLHVYTELVPADFLTTVTEAVIEYLAANADSMAMFDLHCYRRMVGELPQPQQDRVMAVLHPAIVNCVEQDPASWDEYVAQPIEFVKSPESPYYEALHDAVEANLDYAIQTQAEDGSWPPKWSWGGTYPDVWPTAQQEWAGHLTVEMLNILKAFGRIEQS